MWELTQPYIDKERDVVLPIYVHWKHVGVWNQKLGYPWETYIGPLQFSVMHN